MNKFGEYKEHWRIRIKSGGIKKDVIDTVFLFAKWYLIAVATVVCLQRQIIYVPSSSWSVNPHDHQIETVSYLTADKVSLTSWYVPPQRNMPVIVMFHGNAGNISGRVHKQRFFAGLGYGFLLAEYRGYGRNDGYPTEAGLYTDARAAIAWLLEKQGIDESRIIIYGESIGTGVASQMALEFKGARSLILEAPFTRFPALVKDIHPWLGPFAYLTLDQYDNLSKAPYFRMPVLIVSGDQDSVIPYRHSEVLLEEIGASLKKLVILKGGDHNDLTQFGLLDTIAGFLGANYPENG